MPIGLFSWCGALRYPVEHLSSSMATVEMDRFDHFSLGYSRNQYGSCAKLPYSSAMSVSSRHIRKRSFSRFHLLHLALVCTETSSESSGLVMGVFRHSRSFGRPSRLQYRSSQTRALRWMATSVHCKARITAQMSE